MFPSPLVDDLEGILYPPTKELGSLWDISLYDTAVSRCTMFRAASARMKVPQAPLIPQLGCDLTLVI